MLFIAADVRFAGVINGTAFASSGRGCCFLVNQSKLYQLEQLLSV